MQNSLGKALGFATRAQGIGVTLALGGCFVFIINNWGMLKWWKLIGIIVPFCIAYGTFLYGVLCAPNTGNQQPLDKDTYMKFILLYLFADALMLPIMVSFSGGVKQSLFTPLFFAIAAMAVVFVPKSAVLWLKYSPLVWVTTVTLAGYLVVYWLQYWLPHLFSTSGVKPHCLYSMCECAILVGSVILTVCMSHKVPQLP